MTSYSFVPIDSARSLASTGTDFNLIIRQQPAKARVCCGTKERERRPVDPPPIIQLVLNADVDGSQNYLHNPCFFMCASLVTNLGSTSLASAQEVLAGTIVSSLYRLKDYDDSDAGFFIWGDLSVKVEGTFKLKFSLFEVSGHKSGSSAELEVTHLKSVQSQAFTVYSAKSFPGMGESTFLSRSFSDQGVRIKLRKEHRMQMKQTRTPVGSSNKGREERSEEEDGQEQYSYETPKFPNPYVMENFTYGYDTEFRSDASSHVPAIPFEGSYSNTNDQVGQLFEQQLDRVASEGALLGKRPTLPLHYRQNNQWLGANQQECDSVPGDRPAQSSANIDRFAEANPQKSFPRTDENHDQALHYHQGSSDLYLQQTEAWPSATPYAPVRRDAKTSLTSNSDMQIPTTTGQYQGPHSDGTTESTWLGQVSTEPLDLKLRPSYVHTTINLQNPLRRPADLLSHDAKTRAPFDFSSFQDQNRNEDFVSQSGPLIDTLSHGYQINSRPVDALRLPPIQVPSWQHEATFETEGRVNPAHSRHSNTMFTHQ